MNFEEVAANFCNFSCEPLRILVCISRVGKACTFHVLATVFSQRCHAQTDILLRTCGNDHSPIACKFLSSSTNAVVASYKNGCHMVQDEEIPL